MTKSEYTIAVHRALIAVNVTSQIHATLIVLASAKDETSSLSQIGASLSEQSETIAQRIRSNRSLFERLPGPLHKGAFYTLSNQGRQTLANIERAIQTQNQPTK